MPKRFFDDEFKAKKVWVDFQRHQNSSTGYKLKSQISKNKQKTSVKHALNSEVVIKITGASKDFGNLKAHLRYISRNGELEVFSKENRIHNFWSFYWFHFCITSFFHSVTNIEEFAFFTLRSFKEPSNSIFLCTL